MAPEKQTVGAPRAPLREPRWVAWVLRARLAGKDEVGPFALLAERRHPLVRAELFRTRRKRRKATAALAGVPIAVLALVAVLSGPES